MSEHSPIVEQAILALKEQRSQEAAAILKDHIWRDPTDGVAYAFLGVALSEQGDTASALEALERAHYLNPHDAGILYNYGLVLEAAGRPKEARIRFNAALRIDPDYRRALQRIALLDAGGGPNSLGTGAPAGPKVPPAPAAPTEVRQPVMPRVQDTEARTTVFPHPETNGHSHTIPESDEEPVRAAAPAAKKWVRDRTTATEDPAVTEPLGGPAAGPTTTGSSAFASSSASGLQPDERTPGSDAALAPPMMPFAFPPVAGPQPPTWVDQGAVLLKNRWVVLGLCLLFTVGGLVAGIAIRGAGSSGEPTIVDPLASRGLRRGNLAGADLAGLPLSGMDFSDENLQRVRADKVDFSNARLIKADLREARLGQADLTGADLSNANMPRANLVGARGRGAKFTGAFLRGAYLKAGAFRETDFQQAYLSGSNLGHADLTGANLSGADLRGAHLVNTVLNNAILTNTRLQGANLSKARLDRALFKGARFDGKTKWPTGFNPKSRGAVYETPANSAFAAPPVSTPASPARPVAATPRSVPIVLPASARTPAPAASGTAATGGRTSPAAPAITPTGITAAAKPSGTRPPGEPHSRP